MAQAPVAGLTEGLRRAIAALEEARTLDIAAVAVGALARPLQGERVGAALRGEWLGHALHPLATDPPLGCWLAASLLDITMGRQAATASRHLVGLGVATAVPTALAGMAEWPALRSASQRRVAALHALGNGAVLGCYVWSWRLRRRGCQGSGMMLALAGGALAIATSYLGGHLSFGLGAGRGERWGAEERWGTEGRWESEDRLSSELP